MTTRKGSGVIPAHTVSTGVLIEIFPDGRVIVRNATRKTILTIEAQGNVEEKFV